MRSALLKDEQSKVEQIAGAKKEIGDVNRMRDGDLDPFIKTYLIQRRAGRLAPRCLPDED